MLEEIGGVPAVLLTDRMGCLRAATVAGLVVPHPDYLRFATHYGFRPDFCEAADPESKGMVEHLVGYAKSDLLVAQGPFPDLAAANTSARLWCQEVNAKLHTEICAVPAERLLLERLVLRPLPSLRPPLRRGEVRTVDRLGCVRFGSARYSVPYRLVGSKVELLAGTGEIVILHQSGEVARHQAVLPGEVSLKDEHYGSPAGPRAGRFGPARRSRRPSLPSGHQPRPSSGTRLRPAPPALPESLPLSLCSRRLTAGRPWSLPLSGRCGSAATGQKTWPPSLPPGPRCPTSERREDRFASIYPGFLCAPWTPTGWRRSCERPGSALGSRS